MDDQWNDHPHPERPPKRNRPNNNRHITCLPMMRESHHRDKRQGCILCQVLEAILEVEEGGTSRNGPENKKTHDNALHPRDDVDRLYILRKGGRGPPSIQASMQGLKDYIKNAEEY